MPVRPAPSAGGGRLRLPGAGRRCRRQPRACGDAGPLRPAPPALQRAVLARELAGEAALLLVSNPVFRLDFAAVAEIHGRLMAARNCGAAVPRVRRWPAPPTPAPGAVGAPGAPVCDPGRCAASARPATAPRPYPHPLSPPATQPSRRSPQPERGSISPRPPAWPPPATSLPASWAPSPGAAPTMPSACCAPTSTFQPSKSTPTHGRRDKTSDQQLYSRRQHERLCPLRQTLVECRESGSTRAARQVQRFRKIETLVELGRPPGPRRDLRA